MRVSREGLFCHASKLPTLSCNHRHGVKVFGKRHGRAPTSDSRPVPGAGKLHPGIRGAGEIVGYYGRVHGTHHSKKSSVRDKDNTSSGWQAEAGFSALTHCNLL
jgi:hypothetical protein